MVVWLPVNSTLKALISHLLYIAFVDEDCRKNLVKKKTTNKTRVIQVEDLKVFKYIYVYQAELPNEEKD